MQAVVIAVGSELLRAGRKDTNAEWLVGRFSELGIETAWRAVVGDDDATIAQLVSAALQSAEIVVTTGGIGPTEDDRTRIALARALGVALDRDPEAEREIVARFRARGRVASPAQARQADRPSGATWIPNPVGSAPGVLVEQGGRMIVALPGVPGEMRAMFDATLVRRLAGRERSGTAIARRVIRIAGAPEAHVDQVVGDLYATAGTMTTILSSPGMVELVLTAHGPSQDRAEATLAALAAAMTERLGLDVFGADQDTLASVTGGLLAARRATVAVAESCTGGLLGAALTDVPGSSNWFRGGMICYADDLKTSLAGVSPEMLRAHGAVSEAVARSLASGARRACGASVGIGVTGVAGPAGGAPDKPIGTVHIALEDDSGGHAITLDWPGDRESIRRRAVSAALDLLRRHLLAG